jgi:hypothetical protein
MPWPPSLPDGDPPAPGNHLTVLEEKHVVLREVCLDAADVLARDRVVKDELWPDSAEGISGLFIEIITVGCGDDL